MRTCMSVPVTFSRGWPLTSSRLPDHGGDRRAAGHRVGEHGAAAGQPEAGVVERHREPGAERLHPAGALGDLEQARLDVGHPDVAGEHPGHPGGQARGSGRAVSETTSATIERLTSPSRDRSPPPLHAPLQGKRVRTLGHVRAAAATRRGHHPGDDQPQPAAPLRPLARRAPGVAAAPGRTAPGGRRPRLRRLPRHRASSCTTGCGGCARDVEVVGIEIDPARVAAARPLERPGLRFARRRVRGAAARRGPAGGGARVQRAAAVRRGRRSPDAWATTVARLAPDGLLVDGTCDELGRLATWVAVTAAGPVSLSLSWRLRGLERPGRGRRAAAEGADPPQRARRGRCTGCSPTSTTAWARQAPQAAYGIRQRFIATAAAMRDAGWPLLDGPSRWRLGELTLAWDAVAPGAGSARRASVTRGRRGPGCPVPRPMTWSRAGLTSAR